MGTLFFENPQQHVLSLTQNDSPGWRAVQRRQSGTPGPGTAVWDAGVGFGEIRRDRHGCQDKPAQDRTWQQFAKRDPPGPSGLQSPVSSSRRATMGTGGGVGFLQDPDGLDREIWRG